MEKGWTKQNGKKVEWIKLDRAESNSQCHTEECSNNELTDDGFCEFCNKFHYTVDRDGNQYWYPKGLSIVEDGGTLCPADLFEGTPNPHKQVGGTGIGEEDEYEFGWKTHLKVSYIVH